MRTVLYGEIIWDVDNVSFNTFLDNPSSGGGGGGVHKYFPDRDALLRSNF